MKPLLRSFRIFLSQIWRDSMLVAVCVAPLLAGTFFRFGIPAIERALCAHFEEASILSPYYLLFDLFLSVMTPYLFCFASSMVLLTEKDENMSQYMAVTPVGKKGYLISRLAFPALISFLASILLMYCFSLTEWAVFPLIITCLLTSLMSIAVALLIYSMSNNRVEGMATAKMAGLLMLGLPVPFFVFTQVQYLFFLLPSFWIAKLVVQKSWLMLIPSVLTLLAWMWILFRKAIKKMT